MMFKMWLDGSAPGFAEWRTQMLTVKGAPQQLWDMLMGTVPGPVVVDVQVVRDSIVWTSGSSYLCIEAMCPIHNIQLPTEQLLWLIGLLYKNGDGRAQDILRTLLNGF